MIVKPAPGLVIRDPQTMRLLPFDGIHAADTNLHWARLREDGDVTTEPDPQPEPAAEEETGQ